MHSKYEKDDIILEKSEEEKDQDLMDTILKTKKIINEANINYEYAEGKLIDYFLYTMKAEQAKLDYLIGKAKTIGMTIDMGECANLKNG